MDLTVMWQFGSLVMTDITYMYHINVQCQK